MLALFVLESFIRAHVCVYPCRHWHACSQPCGVTRPTRSPSLAVLHALLGGFPCAWLVSRWHSVGAVTAVFVPYLPRWPAAAGEPLAQRGSRRCWSCRTVAEWGRQPAQRPVRVRATAGLEKAFEVGLEVGAALASTSRCELSTK